MAERLIPGGTSTSHTPSAALTERCRARLERGARHIDSGQVSNDTLFQARRAVVGPAGGFGAINVGRDQGLNDTDRVDEYGGGDRYRFGILRVAACYGRAEPELPAGRSVEKSRSTNS